ncbi:MAG TPA: DUF4097 family beta strand repeat-containing protein [Pyrinomonadaceae bacterium]|nr:DUF4097 family beta strand repeat-containing protein [Pyrinomonadaceae bacterium]
MKKVALLIAVLSVAVAALAHNQMRIVHAHAAALSQLSFADPTPDKPKNKDGDKRKEKDQTPRGDELTENFSQSYPLSATGRVSIANINGNVHINVWDQNSVKVDAVKRAYSQQRLSEVSIDVRTTADSVEIRTKYPEDRNYSGRNREERSASVEYTLTIPRRARLDGAELINGSLDINGVQGDVDASLINGNLRASGMGGDVKLSTINGAVEANVANLDKSKSVKVNSVNGSITIYLPSGANAEVKASTLHGAITNDFGLSVDDGQYVGHSLRGQIGSGGAQIKLSNVNGPIAIKRGLSM